MHHFNLGIDKINPTFKLFEKGSHNGVANLNPVLTINGSSVKPIFRYNAKDAYETGFSAWDYGEDLVTAGSGGLFFLESPFTDRANNFSYSGQNSAYFNNADNSYADITTEDIVIEIVSKPDRAGTKDHYIVKADGGTSTGYEIYVHSDGVMTTYIQDASLNTGTQTTNALSSQWHHIMVFIDKSGSMQAYVDGAASGAAADVSSVGSLTNTGLFTLGARGDGLLILGREDRFAYVSVWKKDNWLDTHLQASVALERFTRLTGAYPQKAEGTAIRNTYTRASDGYVDTYSFGNISVLYSVPAGWPRVVTRRDATRDIDNDERINNAFPYSEDFSGFTQTACGITQTSLFRGRPVDGIVGSASDTTHSISYSIQPSESWRHILFGAFKAGNLSAVRLSSTDIDSSSVWAQFKLDGTTESASLTSGGNVISSGIQDMGDDWYQCYITYSGGTASHSHLIVPVSDATVDDTTYTGDGTSVDVHVAYLHHDYSNVNHGRVKPLEYIKTSGNPRALGKLITGYLVETQATNLCLQSEDMSTIWSPTNVSIITGAASSPNGGVNADSLTSTGGSARHYISQPISVTATNTYTLSAYMKAGEKHFGYLYVNNVADGYYDLNKGLVTTVDNVTGSGIEDLGEGWFRCFLTFIAENAIETIIIGVADEDGIDTYTATGLEDLYLYGVQLEEKEFMSSYILTNNSPVTRAADVLEYKMDDGNLDNNLVGSVVCDVFKMNQVQAADHYIWAFSDGESAADRMVAVSKSFATGNPSWFSVISTEGPSKTLSGSFYLSDGYVHRVINKFETDNLVQEVDTVQTGTQNAVTPPNDQDQLDIGTNRGGASGFDGVISNLKIYNKNTVKY